MEAKPEVVVLSANGVDHSGLEKVLRAGQDDDASYAYRFIPSTDTSFPQDLVQQISPKNLVVFLWDPAKLYSIEWFKKMVAEVKKKENNILFCHTGDAQILSRDKDLLDKWKKSFDLTELCFTVEEGVDAEAAQKLLIGKVIELLNLKKPVEILQEVLLDNAPPQSKAYFEYGNTDLNRSHSRQKRANFIKANYVPSGHGLFSVDQLMQLFAIYMSIPIDSELSKSVEKVLADALMSEAENTEYLANKDSGRSTYRGKNVDRISTRLKQLLSQKFSVIYPSLNFERIVGILIELQNCITTQETAWGYKLWGGQEQVQLVDNTIENTMNIMMRMYPCLLKSEITPADLSTLKIGGLQLPTEVVNIIDRLFVKSGNGFVK